MQTSLNLLTDLPADIPTELVQALVETSGLRIERIVSHGHSSPPGFWYDQARNEWVLLIQGAARLSFEDQSLELKPGDFVNIPAHRRHRVDWTDPSQPTIWLAVHYG